MRRKQRLVQQRQKQEILLGICLFGILILSLGLFFSPKLMGDRPARESTGSESPKKTQEKLVDEKGNQTARIIAHGDLLYHDAVYMSAQQEDGSYDFAENFTYVKPWIEQADLAIADFEGTISPDFQLAGYPLFNAPFICGQCDQRCGL